MNISLDILTSGAIDRFMPSIFVTDTLIRFPVVGKDGFRFIGHCLVSKLMECSTASVGYYLEDDSTFMSGSE